MTDQYIIKNAVGKQFNAGFLPVLQEVMKSYELPGLAIGVVSNNEIVYARGFGVQNIETREPVSMTTLFHLASVSKPFVATAIVQLVEQGRIKLDAPVVTYLPYFKLDDVRYRDITVQQMLSHVSGMPDVDDYEWENPRYDEGALECFVRSLTSYKLLSDPGVKFAYSNMAFECLGSLVAWVSGMSFDDYVKEHILNPIGMAGSSFLKPEYLPENWASPHVNLLSPMRWEGYPYNRMHGPSSTLHASALEMCHWAITNINRGHFGESRILTPSSYDLLWKPRAETGDGRRVGLSWFFEEYHGENLIQHGGGDTGFRSYLILLPDKKASVIVLCNSEPAPVEKIARTALDLLLGYEPEPIIPYARFPVFKTLQKEGLEAAAAQWNSFKLDHPDDYDFSASQFYSLLTAVSLNRVQEAEWIARLGVKILPETDLNPIEDELKIDQNRAAEVVLDILHKHRQESHPTEA